MLIRQPQQVEGKNPFFSGTAHPAGTPAVMPHRCDGATSSRNERAVARVAAENGPHWPSTSWRSSSLRSAAEVVVRPQRSAATVSSSPSSRSSDAIAEVPPSELHSALADGSSDVRIIGPISARSDAVMARPARWARSSTPAMISIFSTLAVVIRRSDR